MTPEFSQGADAARAGQQIVLCPYTTGGQRQEWLAGYLSVRPKKPLSPSYIRQLTEQKERPAKRKGNWKGGR